MKQITLLVILLISYKIGSCQVIFSDNFVENIDNNWLVEAESDSAVLNIKNNVLEITTPKGLTIWYKKPIAANVKIEFDALVVKENGTYDRVSDLNCFWMANDPENPDDFFARSAWRKGTFGKYYSLNLYYVGYGGNSNSTTRFRKYNADYQSFLNKTMRPDIIKEYTDSAHLIKPNVWHKIEIIVNNSNIQYSFNNKLLFDHKDPNPLKKGYFGFRTVTNHMKVRNFQITKLP